MAFKELQVPDLGTVRLYKRRGNRSLRLSIANDGVIRVSLPQWVPYSTGLAFVKSKSNWIKTHKKQQLPALQNKQAIGKAHHLYFLPLNDDGPVKTRIRGSGIYVIHSGSLNSADPAVQKAAQNVVRRALKSEADTLLPQRLSDLANKRNIEYNSVSTRYLKSRWGSCNHKKDIVLNIFLMQLPWKLIDYVILHELTHTKVLHHGPLFWEEFDKQLPGAKALRKEIRQYQPHAFFNENA